MAIKGRTAILVDDGIATGATMRAALRSVRRADPKRLVLAVPVAPPDTVSDLMAEADEVVCLHTPSSFRAIGLFYDDFRQLEDADVIRIWMRQKGFRVIIPSLAGRSKTKRQPTSGRVDVACRFALDRPMKQRQSLVGQSLRLLV